jgi:hypothetical protein
LICHGVVSRDEGQIVRIASIVQGTARRDRLVPEGLCEVLNGGQRE